MTNKADCLHHPAAGSAGSWRSIFSWCWAAINSPKNRSLPLAHNVGAVARTKLLMVGDSKNDVLAAPIGSPVLALWLYHISQRTGRMQ